MLTVTDGIGTAERAGRACGERQALEQATADDEYVISDALRSLGLAMGPLLARLRSERELGMTPSQRVADPDTTVSRHMVQPGDLVDRLAHQVRLMNEDVAANAHAGAPEVRRAVGGLGGVLGDLLDARNAARDLRPTGRGGEIAPLLVGAYGHVLDEVELWLARLVRVLADPGAEIARQAPSGGPYEIELALKLPPAPQLAALRGWAMERAAHKPGFWGGVSAIVPGWGLASLLFGGNGDCDQAGARWALMRHRRSAQDLIVGQLRHAVAPAARAPWAGCGAVSGSRLRAGAGARKRRPRAH